MKTPCGHVFCNHCITEWLTPEGRTSCPTCRRTITLANLSAFIVQAPTAAPAVEEASSTSTAGDAAQQRGQTFAIFYPRGSVQAARGRRQSTAQTTNQTTQQTPSRRNNAAQPPQNASLQTPVRSARPRRRSPNGNNTNNSPADRPPRPLLTVLRSISSFGPTPEEREELLSIFNRAYNNNSRIQVASNSPAVKADAAAWFRQIFNARPRIT